MQFGIVFCLTFVFVGAFASGAERRQTLETAVAMRECFDIAYRSQCSTTNYIQKGANIALQCGPDYYQFAETFFALRCATNDGEYCLHAVAPYSKFRFGRYTDCLSVVNSSSCTPACLSYLQDAVDAAGCCFASFWKESISQSLLGMNFQIVLEACDFEAPPACDSSIVDLTVPDNAESCTYEEFWGDLVEYSCNPADNQPLVDALAKNPACVPLARHWVNLCGRGTDGTYCSELFQNAIDPNFPTGIAFEHPHLSNALKQCENYSSFQSAPCPTHCKSALERAIDEVGCCINILNDTVDDVMLPHFSSDVMIACDVEHPGVCKSSLVVGAMAVTFRATATWVYIFFALLYGIIA